MTGSENSLLSPFWVHCYADDFVVMCRTRDEAEAAHALCVDELANIGLSIHPLGHPKNKTRYGKLSKEGPNCLGIRFEGSVTYPDSKVVTRFRGKIEAILKPNTGDSLLKTLQKLSNLLDDWGNCYRHMRVRDIDQKLDEFIKQQVVEQNVGSMANQLSISP